MVPGGFTFPNNARLVGGSLQLKDANGNNVSGTVSNGDSITVLDVGYSKQLTLVQYPVSGGVKQGYVINNTNIIKYNDEYNWYNGTSTEAVFSKHNSTDSGFGTLAARESATKLYEYGGRVHIAYDTSKGMLTKSGYVNYKGRAIPARQKLDIGSIGHKNARLKVYGKSGNGYNLNAYKLGAADDSSRKPKKIFVGFALHGWEDHWRFDGEALVKIGSSGLNKLGDYISANGSLNGWQVCIAPCMNPDGLIAGRTSYGPGRCAVTTGIDLNRCFPTGFSQSSEPRYKTGSTSLGAPEAVALRNLINELSAEASELMVVDCHGWLGFTQGNPDVGKYFTEQFGFTHKTQYSGGFFSTWANFLSNTKGVLLEYPTTTDSFSIVESYATKTYNAIIKMIQSSNGNGGSGSGNGGGSGSGNGNIVVGSKVKITGTHWATGQAIPDWAKNTTHTVSKIDGNRALLQEVTSWIYLNDIVLADGSGSGSGNEDVFNRTGKIINVSSVLNVRSGPGTSYSAIGTLKGGDSVIITNRVKPSGESLYWYKIKFGSGTGYIRSDFVELSNLTELLVYSTFKTKRHDKDGYLADDLECGDYSKERILAINSLFKDDFKLSEDDLFSRFQFMATTLFAVSELETVVIDAIKHFRNGSGSDYKNLTLTKHVEKHRNTKAFIEPLKNKLIEILRKNKGNLEVLKYDKNNLSELASYVQNNLKTPVFGDWKDKLFGGLTILIHDTWLNQVKVTDYKVDGNKFSGNLHYTIYDHFGLDIEDVLKWYVGLDGFRAWFMLQRYDGYNERFKPFCTVMEMDIPFEGTF